MNELVFILPPFIAAAMFAYVAFKFGKEDNRNIAFQILFFILMVGFLIAGMAQAAELAAVQNAADATYVNVLTLANGTYWAMIITAMITIVLLLLFMLWSYLNMSADAGGRKQRKWNRVLHEEK